MTANGLVCAIPARTTSPRRDSMAPTVRTLAPRAVVALVVSLALVVAVVVGVQRFVGWPVVAATVRDVPFTA